MSWWKAFLAGIFGATLISIMLGAANLAGFHVLDFSMMWGTLVGLPIGWKAWVAGFCIHLVVGGIFALIYAGLFEVFSARDCCAAASSESRMPPLPASSFRSCRWSIL